MKKILILAVVAVLALTANAHDFTVDGIYYKILNSNEVAVTYKGKNYYAYYDEYYGDVTIPETVTYNGTTYTVSTIGYEAFSSCSQLVSIEIPNSVITIDSWAFSGCTGLTSFFWPSSVTSIRDHTFRNCNALTSIEIPNSVTSIGVEAFQYCYELKNANIPNSVKSIGNGAFNWCALTSIEIPSSVISIGNEAFFGCGNLMSIVFPDTFISYGSDVFGETAWYNNQPEGVVYAGKVAYVYKGAMPAEAVITLDEGTLGIADHAFENRDSLVKIIIPNSTLSIGEYAFENCTGLTRIEIPNSVTSIGQYAFNNCTGLTNLALGNSIISIGKFAFGRCSNLRYSSISFPESVRSIGEWAFYSTCFSEISFEGDIEYMGFGAFNAEQDAGALQLLAFYGNINNGIKDNVFYHYRATSGECPRYINQLIIGADVDTIKGLKISSGKINYWSDPAPPRDIYSYNPVPPVADENTFLIYGSTVHVPATSLAAYFTAPYWCNFANIVGDAVEPQEVTISEDSVEMQLGSEPIQLSATVSPANTNPNNITWESSNVFIATVYNGQVYAVGAGECDIIAHCLNKKAICHVVVNDTTVTITLDQQEAMVLPNHIITLTPSASPVEPEGYTVTSSEPSVAAARLINGKVQVVGIKEGTTTITVGSTDGAAVPATCLVTVYTESGDVNCDGFIDINDVTGLIDYVLTGNIANLKAANADYNNDNFVDIDDITALIDHVLGK